MGEERYVADPDPLPATYDRVRTAATNAALHRADGRALLETPDGRIATGGDDGSLLPFYEGYAAVSVTLYDGSNVRS